MTNDNFRNNSCPQQAEKNIPYHAAKEELKKGLVVICRTCGYSEEDCDDESFTINDDDTTDAAKLWRMVLKNILTDAKQHFRKEKKSMDFHVEDDGNKIPGPLAAFNLIVDAMPRNRSMKPYPQMLKHLISDVASRFVAAENSSNRTFLPASFRQQFVMIGTIEMSKRAAKADAMHFGRLVETNSINDAISKQVLQKYHNEGSDDLSSGPEKEDGDDMEDDPLPRKKRSDRSGHMVGKTKTKKRRANDEELDENFPQPDDPRSPEIGSAADSPSPERGVMEPNADVEKEGKDTFDDALANLDSDHDDDDNEKQNAKMLTAARASKVATKRAIISNEMNEKADKYKEQAQRWNELKERSIVVNDSEKRDDESAGKQP